MNEYRVLLEWWWTGQIVQLRWKLVHVTRTPQIHTCRLISWEGRWTSIIRSRRIIACEALDIIRLFWSSHHKKTVFPLLDETWPWSWRCILRKIRLLLWFILATSLRMPEGETTKVSLNWNVVFYYINGTKKGKNELSLGQIYLSFFFFIQTVWNWNTQLLFHISLVINLLTPNVNYSGRTVPLTSKVAFYIFIQQI